MKLATTTGDFSAYSSDGLEIIEYIARSGFRYIDYNFEIDYNRKTGVFGTNPQKYIEDLKDKADRLGVAFVQAHSPMGAPLDEDAEFVKMTADCIRACGELSISNIVVHSGYMPDISKEECFERNKAFYEKLLPVAEECNVNILTENFNKMCIDNIYWVDNATDLCTLVDYVNHPRFKAVWDVGHGNLQQMPQHEELAILGERVCALHVQDNMGYDDSHMAPFFGITNPDSLMKGLVDIGYNGYFTFESPNIMLPVSKRRIFDGKSRIGNPSIEVKLRAEQLLYEIGKQILCAYNCFEE